MICSAACAVCLFGCASEQDRLNTIYSEINKLSEASLKMVGPCKGVWRMEQRLPKCSTGELPHSGFSSEKEEALEKWQINAALTCAHYATVEAELVKITVSTSESAEVDHWASERGMANFYRATKPSQSGD